MKRILVVLTLVWALAALVLLLVLHRQDIIDEAPAPSEAPAPAVTRDGPASAPHPPRHEELAADPDPLPTVEPTQPPTTPTPSFRDAVLRELATSEEDDAPAEPAVWPATAEGIKGAIREALPDIRRCYEQALKLEPDMSGRITVNFTIGTTDTASGLGLVTSVGIEEATVEQTTMDDCLLDAMESLQFDPPADGDFEVSYPFVFSVE